MFQGGVDGWFRELRFRDACLWHVIGGVNVMKLREIVDAEAGEVVGCGGREG